jgi:hypothetical protein
MIKNIYIYTYEILVSFFVAQKKRKEENFKRGKYSKGRKKGA